MNLSTAELRRFVGGTASWEDTLQCTIFERTIKSLRVVNVIRGHVLVIRFTPNEASKQRSGRIDLADYRTERTADGIRLFYYMAGKSIALKPRRGTMCTCECHKTEKLCEAPCVDCEVVGCFQSREDQPDRSAVLGQAAIKPLVDETMRRLEERFGA